MMQRKFIRVPMFFMAMFASIMASSNTVMQASASSSGATALSVLRDIDLRFFVAGGTCAAFSHGITTPIDVVKTRMQADPKKYNKGMIVATSDIIKEEGPGTLLVGLGPTVVGYGVEGAMKFGVYEIAKPVLKALLSTATENREPLAYVLASAFAGAVAALLLCPMESLRIKQVTDKNFAADSILTGIPKLIKQDGFFSLFAGVLAMLAKQIPYTFGKQVSFDILATFFYQLFGTFMEVVNKWLVSISAAACASLAACFLSQPGDMILTETYKTDTPAPFAKVIHDIWVRGHVLEFFRGLRARFLHVGMIITSQLVVYDIVKQLLGLPATGAH